MKLVTPTREHLPSYVEALDRGWSPNNMDSERHRLRELREIADDAALFLANMTDRDASAGDVELPDGSFVKRLPGIRRFMWDDAEEGGFCGTIGFRWQPGGGDLPPHLLGHIGFAVVPWHRGKGHAAEATRQILPEAWALGMSHVTITCDPDNPASRRSIETLAAITSARGRSPPPIAMAISSSGSVSTVRQLRQRALADEQRCLAQLGVAGRGSP